MKFAYGTDSANVSNNKNISKGNSINNIDSNLIVNDSKTDLSSDELPSYYNS